MNIYIDESGSFVWHPRPGSWSVVAALAAPESSRRHIDAICTRLRRKHGAHRDEVKLPQLGEAGFTTLLEELAKADLALFATVTDSGLNLPDLVAAHRTQQVADIRANIPRMRFEGGRAGLELLASQLEALPDQLYVQLVCQVDLLDDVIRRGINYYVQRQPATLREVRWRIDQKNTTRTAFEDAFVKIAPALLQSRSIRQPAFRVRGFDYRYFSQYEFEDGRAPEYLQTEYGLPPMEGFNLQRLVRGNLQFHDSKASAGLQIVDLLASGLRRALKLNFDDPHAVAGALGRLTIQNSTGRTSINLATLAQTSDVPPRAATIVQLIDKNSKPFIHARYRNDDA